MILALTCRYWAEITSKRDTKTEQCNNHHAAEHLLDDVTDFPTRTKHGGFVRLRSDRNTVFLKGTTEMTRASPMHKYSSLSCLFLPLKYSYLFLLSKLEQTFLWSHRLHGSRQDSSERFGSRFFWSDYLFIYFFRQKSGSELSTFLSAVWHKWQLNARMLNEATVY